MKHRYKKLNITTIPMLEDLQYPAAQKINPDYVEQPRNPRKCKTCGNIHDLIIENTIEY